MIIKKNDLLAICNEYLDSKSMRHIQFTTFAPFDTRKCYYNFHLQNLINQRNLNGRLFKRALMAELDKTLSLTARSLSPLLV